jgi:hypothetical protein
LFFGIASSAKLNEYLTRYIGSGGSMLMCDFINDSYLILFFMFYYEVPHTCLIICIQVSHVDLIGLDISEKVFYCVYVFVNSGLENTKY